MLLGTESRVLVGVRGGRPTWKKIVRIAPGEVVFALRDTILTTYGVKRNVGPKEAWMVPDFREFDLEGKKRYEQDGGYLETNRTLIENAFYKQRYLIDPEGVYVKVTNARDVTGIYLKACSGGGDLVDILVRLETIRGAIFFNITEERLLEDVRASSVWLNGESYYDYLVCQVYHDLVTAATVSGTRTIRDGAGAGASTPPQGDEPTWTVIPRKVRNVVREPRAEIPQRSVTEPHRVTGHLRKAPMTDKHRDALLEFERQTGLEVLRFVPEGHTSHRVPQPKTWRRCRGSFGIASNKHWKRK